MPKSFDYLADLPADVLARAAKIRLAVSMWTAR
jgi:hypothetical protein